MAWVLVKLATEFVRGNFIVSGPASLVALMTHGTNTCVRVRLFSATRAGTCTAGGQRVCAQSGRNALERMWEGR